MMIRKLSGPSRDVEPERVALHPWSLPALLSQQPSPSMKWCFTLFLLLLHLHRRFPFFFLFLAFPRMSVSPLCCVGRMSVYACMYRWLFIFLAIRAFPLLFANWQQKVYCRCSVVACILEKSLRDEERVGLRGKVHQVTRRIIHDIALYCPK